MVYGSTLLELRGGCWCQISRKKSVTKVNGSTLLALRGGVLVSNLQEKMCYEGVQVNIISITRGWVSNFQGKKLRNTRMAPFSTRGDVFQCNVVYGWIDNNNINNERN